MFNVPLVELPTLKIVKDQQKWLGLAPTQSKRDGYYTTITIILPLSGSIILKHTKSKKNFASQAKSIG